MREGNRKGSGSLSSFHCGNEDKKRVRGYTDLVKRSGLIEYVLF